MEAEMDKRRARDGSHDLNFSWASLGPREAGVLRESSCGLWCRLCEVSCCREASAVAGFVWRG